MNSHRSWWLQSVVISIAFSALSFPSLAAVSCQDLFLKDTQRLSALTIRYQTQFDQINNLLKELDPKILSGKSTPGWAEFNQLEILIGLLSKMNRESAGNFKDELDQLAPLIKTQRDVRNLLRRMARQENSEDSGARTYAPTEYELKLAYQNLLNRVNDQLPDQLKFPIQRLQLDTRRQTLETQAEAILANLEKRFASVFSSTGFESYAAFEAHLRSSKNPQIKRALRILDADQVEVVMRRPDQGRFWIAKTGFHNQFVTGSSQGMMSHETRNLAENFLLGVRDLKTYTETDAEVKPKYATLATRPEAKLNSDLSNSAQYGPDLYRFKMDNIKSRLTFYPTDSLGPGMRQTVDDGRAWNEHLIPWSYRLLMVPFMLHELKNGEFKGERWPDKPMLQENMVFQFSAFYWEAQILGSLKLSDVREFEFSTDPPSGEFLQKLKFHNIKILDGRVSPAKEWKE